jgi:hypothetical protein
MYDWISAGTLQSKRPPEEKHQRRQQHIGELWKRQRPGGKLRRRQKDSPMRLGRGYFSCRFHSAAAILFSIRI